MLMYNVTYSSKLLNCHIINIINHIGGYIVCAYTIQCYKYSFVLC